MTIGHGNRHADDFIALLVVHQVSLLVDVRRYPSSKRNPQFNAPALRDSTAAAGIDYRKGGHWFGGHRELTGGEQTELLRTPAFRAYAAHMQTRTFREGLGWLRETAAERRVALMCAETHPSHCHRSLISDYLSVLGGRVMHIHADDAFEVHEPHAAAHWDGEHFNYTASQFDLF